MAMRYFAICLALQLYLAGAARAVIIAFGDGSGNTSAPANDPGWSNVGIRGGASAIYLGNGWVLTANHVGAGSTIFKGQTYSMVPNSAFQLLNPSGVAFTPATDLLMYKISGDPGLPSLSISDTAPQVGWNVTMIGNGRDRLTTPQFWDATWHAGVTPTVYTGFTWATTNHMRWGTNVIEGVSSGQGLGSNSEAAFATSFSLVGTTYEAQGASGDSGGAVFHQDMRTGEWDLTGLMFAVSTLAGQPSGTAVYGNYTYSADLSVYRNEINQVMWLNGDVNFDGIVNAADISLIASNWLVSGTGASAPFGDANHDGIVNAADITIVAQQWLKTVNTLGGVTNLSEVPASAVPEPATITLAVAGLIAALLFRRRLRRTLLRV